MLWFLADLEFSNLKKKSIHLFLIGFYLTQAGLEVGM